MVLLLGALAVGIELLGDLPDALLLFLRALGERERLETTRRGVYRSILKRASCCQSIRYVDTAAQDAEMKGVLKCDNNQLVLRHNFGREEREYSMMCGLGRDNEASQAF
jgi:hypothetical protein